MERTWRENLQGAKSEHAVQISEMVKSVSYQQHLANIRRREMSELTSEAETILGEEQVKQRKLLATLHRLNVSFNIFTTLN